MQSKADGTPTFGENQEDKVSQKPRGEQCWGRRSHAECWKEVQLNEDRTLIQTRESH